MNETRPKERGPHKLPTDEEQMAGGVPSPLAATEFAEIRMYDVGFGDAFLLRLPTIAGPRTILFDCGTLSAGIQPIGRVVESIAETVRGDDGVPRIDVVVATHRHKDHVSGFSNALWRSVEVKEVWMPWTEHPTDTVARRIREVQTRLALALEGTAARALAANPANDQWRGLQLLAANALSNQVAMETLHHGFAGTRKAVRRFLPGPEGERVLRTDVLPRVVVHILGPSRDEEIIRDMDPPAGKSYLRLEAAGVGGTDGAPKPFAQSWVITPGSDQWTLNSAPLPTDDDKSRLGGFAKETEYLAAVALDAAVNGTSLMLVLQVADAYLLFPGDAQWGTWRVALADPEWRELLKRTTFYKVGHHASHNATPLEFVESLLSSNSWAMASLKKVPNWPSIPREELLTGLRQKCPRLVRSDELDQQSPAGFTPGPGYVEARIPVSETEEGPEASSRVATEPRTSRWRQRPATGLGGEAPAHLRTPGGVLDPLPRSWTGTYYPSTRFRLEIRERAGAVLKGKIEYLNGERKGIVTRVVGRVVEDQEFKPDSSWLNIDGIDIDRARLFLEFREVDYEGPRPKSPVEISFDGEYRAVLIGEKMRGAWYSKSVRMVGEFDLKPDQ